MKVAFATQDKERVDAHFGWAKYIAIYEINAEGYRYLETHDFGGELAEDGNEDKLAPKLAVIMDCAIVYVAAIGGSARGAPLAYVPNEKSATVSVIDTASDRRQADFAVGVSQPGEAGAEDALGFLGHLE